jgi:hypothetical protein
VEIIDIVPPPPPPPPPQQQQQQQGQQQKTAQKQRIHTKHKDNTSLSTHLNLAANKNYTSRYMSVLLPLPFPKPN